jgi:hypothetical protein
MTSSTGKNIHLSIVRPRAFGFALGMYKGLLWTTCNTDMPMITTR